MKPTYVVQERPGSDVGEIEVFDFLGLAIIHAGLRRFVTGKSYWIWDREGNVVRVFEGDVRSMSL